MGFHLDHPTATDRRGEHGERPRARSTALGVEILALYGMYLKGNVSAYGALGAALVVMLWMKLVSQLFFFGAELCKVISSKEMATGGAMIRPMAN